MRFKTFVTGWNKFWFEPALPTPIALFRIVFGLLMMFHVWVISVDRYIWLHDSGIVTIKTLNLYDRLPRIDLFRWAPTTDKIWVDLLIAVIFFLAFLVTIGLFTRLSSFLLWVGIISMHNRSPLVLNSGFMLAQILGFFLIFAQAGGAMSVDRLIRIMRGKETDKLPTRIPWGQRLIQVQVSVIYLHAALSKMNGTDWLRGNVVHYVSRSEEWNRFDIPLFQYQWFTRMMTWGTLVIEGALGPLVWFRETRYFVLALGVMLHMGLEISMNIHLFQWITISPYVTFIEPQHLTLIMDWVRARVARLRGPAVPVFYDGACEACNRGGMLIRAMDILGRFRTVDFRSPADRARTPEFGEEQLSRAEREMLILRKDGSWVGGFEAFRTLAWGLPLLWPVAPLLYLPGVKPLGTAAYSWISRNRFRFLGVRCASGSCSS